MKKIENLKLTICNLKPVCKNNINNEKENDEKCKT